MLELTGFGSVLRGIGILYWVLAIGAVGLAIWKGKTWQRKTLWAGVAVVAFGFLPAKVMIEKAQKDAYAREAWAYFKKKCDEKAGEKIYKTYSGVKSVLVVKPLPPATEKDLYDQFWYGDPYSSDIALLDRGERLAGTLIGRVQFLKNSHAEQGFEFLEQQVANGTEQMFQRVAPIEGPPFTSKLAITKPESRFGISWEDISTPEDRKYWIAASRLRVFDLTDSTIIAERTGYFIEAGFGSKAGQRRPWQSSRGPSTTCPPINNRTFEDRWFVLRVLKPAEGDRYGK